MSTSANRRTVAGALALLAAFACGGAVAILAGSAPISDGPGGAPGGAGSDLLAGLDLRPEQRVVVDSILARTRDVGDSIFAGATEALRVEADRARRGILSVLDEDQGRRFEDRLRAPHALRVRRLQVGDSVIREDTLPSLPPGG